MALSEKDIIRCNKELLELHKRCLLDYLVKRSVNVRVRKKFFILYDHFIKECNIKEYFFAPAGIFVQHLVKGSLEKIRNYYYK